MLSISSDHEWALAGEHVVATKCPICPKGRRWEGEDESAGGFCCDSGAADSGAHLQLCCSMWKSLQAPDFYGSCGKMQSQRWVIDGTMCAATAVKSPHCFPHCLFSWLRLAWSHQGRSRAPTLIFSLCQVHQSESSWANHKNISLHRQDRFSFKVRSKGLLHGFPNINTVWTHNYYFTHLQESSSRWNQCFLVFRVSPDLFRKTTHFSIMFLCS